jgi:hypothetical protein
MMDTQKSCNNCYLCVSDDPNNNFCDASASCIDNSEWVPTVEYVEILESELQQMKEAKNKIETQLFNLYGKLFKNYAWTDCETAIDLMGAEILVSKATQVKFLRRPRANEAKSNFEEQDFKPLAETKKKSS